MMKLSKLLSITLAVSVLMGTLATAHAASDLEKSAAQKKTVEVRRPKPD